MYTFCMYVTLSLVLQSCLLKAHFHLNSLLQGRHFTGTSTVKYTNETCLDFFLTVHYTKHNEYPLTLKINFKQIFQQAIMFI